MSWTVTKEEADNSEHPSKQVPAKLHVRAIINIGEKVDGPNELKELIASLQKHVKSDE